MDKMVGAAREAQAWRRLGGPEPYRTTVEPCIGHQGLRARVKEL